jgi:hypothetical protein
VKKNTGRSLEKLSIKPSSSRHRSITVRSTAEGILAHVTDNPLAAGNSANGRKKRYDFWRTQ